MSHQSQTTRATLTLEIWTEDGKPVTDENYDMAETFDEALSKVEKQIWQGRLGGTFTLGRVHGQFRVTEGLAAPRPVLCATEFRHRWVDGKCATCGEIFVSLGELLAGEQPPHQ